MRHRADDPDPDVALHARYVVRRMYVAVEARLTFKLVTEVSRDCKSVRSLHHCLLVHKRPYIASWLIDPVVKKSILTHGSS